MLEGKEGMKREKGREKDKDDQKNRVRERVCVRMWDRKKKVLYWLRRNRKREGTQIQRGKLTKSVGKSLIGCGV